MPIKSYFAYPQEGKKMELLQVLANLNFCRATPATKEELLVLITDTDNEIEEASLLTQLQSISCIQNLAMVTGFNSSKM